MKIFFKVGKTRGTVDNPCIQTKIKILYNYKLKELLTKKNVNGKDAAEIELLKYALEKFDFSKLRLQCEKHRIDGENIAVIEQGENYLKVFINKVEIWQEYIKSEY